MVNVCGETSPIVACEIGGAKVHCLIDTGSRVSLVKKGTLDVILKDWQNVLPKKDRAGKLVGITGDALDTVGCFEIPLTLGGHEIRPACFVCTDGLVLPVAGIIGQDVLRGEDIDLLLSEGVLRIGNARVEITNWAHQVNAVEPKLEEVGGAQATVTLLGPCVLPPLSECLFQGKVSSGGVARRLGVLETHDLGVNGVVGAHALVKMWEDATVPVRLVNVTCQEIRLPQNKVVGTLVDAYEVGSVDPDAWACNRIEQVDLLDDFDFSHITTEEKASLLGLIDQHRDVFSSSRSDLGRCEAVKHRISTGEAAPVYRRAYRIPYSKREEMEEQVDQLLAKGIIEHSTSPWGAPALLVEKPDGSYRFVVDYRDLNRVTRVDPYPLPNIQETLSQLGSARRFTVVDMTSGYWQIEMDSRDREKTAFNTPSGHYHWTRMPMGLVNSAAVWQRTADVVLAGLLGKICYVYLDDIIIYSNSLEEHLEDLKTVFQRVRAAGLKLKPSKCQFLKPEVKYLGHIVSAEGVRPDPAKIACVRDFPAPQNKTEVRRFLGLMTYYRRHVPHFAELARPLTQLTGKKPFAWGTDAGVAFEVMKQKLTEAPILRFPDFSRPFTLATDASKFAVGAVLSQEFDGQEHPVAYASRQLNGAEQAYGATEQECLAVVWAVRHFRCYLYGRHFRILTDCQPLKWLMSTRDQNSRLARWNLRLQEYDFEIVHRSGKTNQNADALSRAVVREVNVFLPSTDGWRVKEEQRKDTCLRATIAACEASEEKCNGQFYLDQGGLLRLQTDKPGETGRMVIPSSMVGELLRVHHDAPCAGHPGARKTRQRVAKQYFWRGMRRDIVEYCRACKSCSLRKTPKGRRPAPFQEFGQLSSPFERTAMDIVGPLPVTTAGSKYILVFVDHLTRFAEAFPMPDQKAETVARMFVEGVVLRHGVPDQLLTDQGANFTSRLMKEVYESLGISKLQTTAYHPECNGAVERLNQTVIKMLGHFVAHDQRDWDLWLPFALFAYNSAAHEGTKESPFYLLYGRDAVVPSLARAAPAANYGTLENYRSELVQRLAISHRLASDALVQAAQTRKTRHDKTSRDPQYKVGDPVYLQVAAHRRGTARKLAPSWCGPFRIVEVLSDITCRIRRIGEREEKIVHVNRLKPAHLSFPSECASGRPVDDPPPAAGRQRAPNPADVTLRESQADATLGAGADPFSAAFGMPIPIATHGYSLRSRD